jgi:hypothetical protein
MLNEHSGVRSEPRPERHRKERIAIPGVPIHLNSTADSVLPASFATTLNIIG